MICSVSLAAYSPVYNYCLEEEFLSLGFFRSLRELCTSLVTFLFEGFSFFLFELWRSSSKSESFFFLFSASTPEQGHGFYFWNTHLFFPVAQQLVIWFLFYRGQFNHWLVRGFTLHTPIICFVLLLELWHHFRWPLTVVTIIVQPRVECFPSFFS